MQITKSLHRIASATAACKTCLYFTPNTTSAPSTAGICRRYPPVVVPNYAAQWPQVDETQACGEYSPQDGWQ